VIRLNKAFENRKRVAAGAYFTESGGEGWDGFFGWCDFSGVAGETMLWKF
jgi:hypothetical protein